MIEGLMAGIAGIGEIAIRSDQAMLRRVNGWNAGMVTLVLSQRYLFVW
jgi:hypothetical protein